MATILTITDRAENNEPLFKDLTQGDMFKTTGPDWYMKLNLHVTHGTNAMSMTELRTCKFKGDTVVECVRTKVDISTRP